MMHDETRRSELSEVPAVRDQVLRLNIRRAEVSPSDSADTTINERLQVLRRNGRVRYDLAGSRAAFIARHPDGLVRGATAGWQLF